MQHVVPMSIFPSSLAMKATIQDYHRCLISGFVDVNCLQWNFERKMHCS